MHTLAGVMDHGTGQPRRGALRSLAFGAALAARTAAQGADQLIAPFAPKDRPGLLIFVFHCVFADQAEADSGVIDPHERATCQGLARLIDYFRGHGYRFVGAREIDRGLEPDGRYAHLTFDDGFANNLQLIDLLAREEAHATVFPSIGHVRQGSAFWWNVVYRERRRRGRGAVAAEYGKLRQMTVSEVNLYLLAEFGSRALEPTGDIDRPLTPAELNELASSPWIEIGNHTIDHAVLPSCGAEEAERQVDGAQRWLQETLGEAPFIISYPNGDATAETAKTAERLGLRLGVTVVPKRNRLPIGDPARMLLGRVRIVFGRRERARMRALRSSVQIAAAARGLVLGRGEPDAPLSDGSGGAAD